MNLTLSNAFAALEVRKAKKKKPKDSEKKKKSSKEAARKEDALQLEREIFSRPQFNVSNWADCDDEDEDFDPAVETGGAGDTSTPINGRPLDDGHDSEEEIDLEKEFGVELGPEGEPEAEPEPEVEAEPEAEKSSGGDDGMEAQANSCACEAQEQMASTHQRNESRGAPPERTMSKKEIKKKEMEELDAMLAELGISTEDSGKKQVNGESSGLKRKKSRKKLSSIDAGSPDTKVEPVNTLDTNDDTQPSADQEEREESGQEEAVVLDPEVAKPLKPRIGGKKKSQKKLGGGAAAAAAEARARSKKKGKKDTTHYNQAPTR